MRFTATKDISKNIYLRNILILILISLVLFILSYSYFQIHSIGYLPNEIKNYILGNEELFIEAKSFIVILEEIHIAIFTYLITAIIGLMVFIQIKYLEKYFYQIALFIMICIFVDTVSQPLILLWEPFIYVKSIFFVLSNTSLLILLCMNILFLYGKLFNNLSSNK